jgi:hypothetical protein
MPNFIAVVKTLAQDVVGRHVWNGARGECRTMPTDQYDATEEAMAAVLERVVVAVDWPRLLMEAAWRHAELHPERKESERYWSEATGVCGECLAEAMLATRTGSPDWERNPAAELTRQSVDWPAVVAASLQHRRSPVSHQYATPHRSR